MEKNKNKFAVLKSKYFIAVAIIVVIICGFLAYTVSENSKVKDWDNKAFPGVNIKGMDIAGKTKEEIVQMVNESFVPRIGEKKINVSVGDKLLSYKYGDLSAGYNVEEAAEKAVEYGKDSSVFTKKRMIKNKNNSKYDIDLPLTYDEAKIAELEKKIKDKVDIAPKSATISKNGNGFNIIPEVVGYELNNNNLDSKVKESLNGNLEEETNLSFELQEAQARVKSSDLQKIKGQMSTFSTEYHTSGEDRSYNISLVTSLTNGTLLMPGETFSFSQASLKGKGSYKIATMYQDNKVVPAEAGGICQVSSTLYRAVMRANIRSVERRNHSLPVYYAEPSLDATMAWGGVDYKFKNTYDFPIYIEGYTSNKTVTINIYGDPDGLGGKTYDMVSESLETIPQKVNYVDAPELPEGTNVTEKAGAPGRKSKAYLVTYENGAETKKELISTDTYGSQPTVIKRGTKKVEAPPAAE